MRVIIEHGETKREINGAFNVCASPADLLLIAKQLMRAATSENAGYGWVQVLPCGPQESITDTPPMPWDAR